MAASADGNTLLIVSLELVDENNRARRKVYENCQYHGEMAADLLPLSEATKQRVLLLEENS